MSKTEYIPVRKRELTVLDGVGPKRAELFGKLGVNTVDDLLFFFPRAYQNRGSIHLIAEAEENVSCSFMLTVATRPSSAVLKGRMVLTKFTAFDDSAKVTVTFFNSRFVERVFEVGETYRFWGKVTKEGSRYFMSSPTYEPANGPKPLLPLFPVYHLTSGLNDKNVIEAIRSAVDLIGTDQGDADGEIIPAELSEKLGLIEEYDALYKIHFPDSFDDIEEARKYFSARNALIFTTAIHLSHSRMKVGEKCPMANVDMSPFYRKLGFEMTGAQKRSVSEIISDMTDGSSPMTRLLSGDVGSGKTAVAAAAIFLAVRNGFQAVLMAPTEILAEQHYAKLSRLFDGLGFGTVLLTGSLTEKNKESARMKIADGTADIIIGTHALLTKSTAFYNPGLVITDEQHRFGVTQRAILGGDNGKGTTPDFLVMTATPIPRTMALIMYGDLSVSVLDELPKGRQEISTYTVDGRYMPRLLDFIRKTVGGGNRVYIVCPSIEPPDEDLITDFSADNTKRPASAVETHKEISEALEGDGIAVSLLHGRMNAKEKAGIMSDFAAGAAQVLVSTTVIEVGIDVPEATVMIVLSAERFGLAQLHQLRGRVGRGKDKSYCILVSDSKGEKSEKRLQFMKSTTDGYKIAEYDLEMRGPGDYLPSGDGKVRQHGDFDALRLSDMNTLKEISEYAEKLTESDPELTSQPGLKKKIEEMFEAEGRMLQ